MKYKTFGSIIYKQKCVGKLKVVCIEIKTGSKNIGNGRRVNEKGG
jgi:hypothetical protein